MKDCTRVLIALGLFGIGGCYRGPSSDVTYDQVIATGYDNKADFKTPSTFAVNPSVSLISDTSDAEVLSDMYAQPIIAQIVKDMTSRGYVQVDKSASPDLGINVEVIKNLQVQAYNVPYYWWGWSYAGYPGYWGYPGYGYYAPWATYATAYQTGSMIIEMFNLTAPKNAATLAQDASNPKIPLMWSAIVYGVLSTSGSYNLQTAISGIDQAFSQSPYIGK